MRLVVLAILILISGELFAQNPMNQKDELGRKQGFWTKKDVDGKIVYQATFKDDQPVGEMKRFHSNGKLMAVMNFKEGTDISEAQLFDENGKLIAQGEYSGQKKTGEWTYILDSKVTSTETYLNGLKSGISKRFYPGGELLEESNWQNDKLHGIYRSYFQDGKLYLECNYTNGQRNGKFKTCFPNGSLEMDANYFEDLKDSVWRFFDVEGELMYTLKYDLGKLLNPEVQDSIQQVRMNSYKTREDQVPDPEKFMQNPEEYMRQLQNRQY